MPSPISADTIVGILAQRIATDGDQVAIHFKRDDAFTSRTWNDIAQDIRRLTTVLLRLGVQPGDRIAQLSENRYEWIVTDFAIQAAQAIHVPMHAPLAGHQAVEQVRDSGSRIVLVSNLEQAQKLDRFHDRLPPETRIFSHDPCEEELKNIEVHTVGSMIADISNAELTAVEQQAVAALRPDSLATILYTSGTTGEPKGVVLSQNNIVSNVLATLETFGQEPGDVRINFLPLSHIFARICDLYIWMIGGSELALAESRETVLADCATIRPTILSGVPYFFERVQRYLIDQGEGEAPDSLQRIFGGRIRVCCSGGAALPDHVFDFYNERGVKLIQGYGLTESSPVISLSTLDTTKRGTVGRPLDGVEVKIADDGEILARGPNIMVGFWQRPEATAEVIRDGWLHTGDIGELDEDGYLKITGRKKELIVTAAGKNIVPVFVESLLCRDPLIEQALVIGDGRKYLSALIVPNADSLRAEITSRGIAVTSPQDALANAEVLELYRQRIETQLVDVSYYEQVRRFTLLDRAFSIENDEMTPKLSLRRKVIETNFAEQIESMYS